MDKRPDVYEERYMAGRSALALSRARMAWWAHVIFAALTILIVYALVHTHAGHSWGAMLIGGALAAVTIALWLTSMIVRVTLDREELHIQHGLIGPRIPLADIVDIEIEKYDLAKALKYVGWGFGGWSLDGSFGYAVPGVKRGLAIRYRRDGSTRRVFVSSEEPESLLRAVREASSRGNVQEGAHLRVETQGIRESVEPERDSGSTMSALEHVEDAEVSADDQGSDAL